MRINWKLVNYDMLEEIQIPKCPSMFRTQAECIILLIAELEPYNYNKMSQFDKYLVVKYWQRFDNASVLLHDTSLEDWYLAQATDPTLICRARRWLVEHNYLVPTQGVTDRAQESSEKWRVSVKG